MKPKILEQTLKQPLKQPKSVGKIAIKNEEPITRSTVFPTSRPTTSHSYKPVNRPVLTKRVRTNDPVSRYQQMSTAWRKDLFLEKGANKKEGRKLALSERNRILGLLYWKVCNDINERWTNNSCQIHKYRYFNLGSLDCLALVHLPFRELS